MAKKKDDDDAVEINEQDSLFPELDKSKPEDKSTIAKIRKWRRDKRDHAEGIASLKETMDESKEAVIADLHGRGWTKVKLDGEIIDITSKGEDLRVRKAKPDTETEPSDD